MSTRRQFCQQWSLLGLGLSTYAQASTYQTIFNYLPATAEQVYVTHTSASLSLDLFQTQLGQYFTAYGDAGEHLGQLRLIQAQALTPNQRDQFFLRFEHAAERDWNEQIYYLQHPDGTASIYPLRLNPSHGVRGYLEAAVNLHNAA